MAFQACNMGGRTGIMKETITIKVKLDKDEKIQLEQIRRLINSSKLPDNVSYTCTFNKEKLKKQLRQISISLNDALKMINDLQGKLDK
jgi:hypothetical protein